MTQPALYRFLDQDGALLWVGVSANPFARLASHLAAKGWRDEIAHVEIQRFPDRAAAEQAETLAIETERPRHNVQVSRTSPRGPYSKVAEPQTKFAAWMKANGITNTAMAARLGMTQSGVSYIARGVHPPSCKVREAIEHATFGAVPASSWASETAQ